MTNDYINTIKPVLDFTNAIKVHKQDSNTTDDKVSNKVVDLMKANTKINNNLKSIEERLKLLADKQ